MLLYVLLYIACTKILPGLRVFQIRVGIADDIEPGILSLIEGSMVKVIASDTRVMAGKYWPHASRIWAIIAVVQAPAFFVGSDTLDIAEMEACKWL